MNQLNSQVFQDTRPETFTGIRVQGFVADLEGYAYRVEEEDGRLKATLWYVSMVKDQTTVNAIWASLVKEPPQPVVLFSQDREGRITRELMATFVRFQRSGGSTSHQASLRQSGAVHKIILPECARAERKRKPQKQANPQPGPLEFLLLIPTAAGPKKTPVEPSRLYYERLKESTSEPLHPSWTEWLWQRGCRQGEILTLEYSGLSAAYLCRLPDEQFFSNEIETAIRQGLLRVEEKAG